MCLFGPGAVRPLCFVFISFINGILAVHQRADRACCLWVFLSRYLPWILLTYWSNLQKQWGLRFQGASYPPDSSAPPLGRGGGGRGSFFLCLIVCLGFFFVFFLGNSWKLHHHLLAPPHHPQLLTAGPRLHIWLRLIRSCPVYLKGIPLSSACGRVGFGMLTPLTRPRPQPVPKNNQLLQAPSKNHHFVINSQEGHQTKRANKVT